MVAQTALANEGILVLGLSRDTKPSDGDRIAVKHEDAHPGFRPTRVDPYPGQATMTQPTPQAVAL